MGLRKLEVDMFKNTILHLSLAKIGLTEESIICTEKPEGKVPQGGVPESKVVLEIKEETFVKITDGKIYFNSFITD